MKEIFRGKRNLILLAVLFLAACTTGDKQVHEDGSRYTCPMHPQIIAEEPGTCPICKMDLVAVSRSGQDAEVRDSLAYLVKPTNQIVVSGIKTVRPSEGNRYGAVSVRGVINYNTNNLNVVSSRVNGRIERLYVNYNFQPVRKGQKLMEVYSPDLAAAQQELLFLHENDEPGLLKAAKQKLLLLGMTNAQINHILKTGKIDYRVILYSPYSGYLIEQLGSGTVSPRRSAAGGTVISNEGGESASMGGGSMGSMSEPEATTPEVPLAVSTPLLIREGQYISASQKLFGIMDATSVWAEFFVHPEQLQEFTKGTQIRVSSIDIPDLTTETEINLIQPFYNEGNNFSLVRSVISNQDAKWKIGQLVKAEKRSGAINGTWLPRTAVLQTGTRHISFVKRPFGFRPVNVQVSGIVGDWVNIGSSVSKTAEVAANAWFLVDSESFIKVDSLKK